jgi:hypothetical protein
MDDHELTPQVTEYTIDGYSKFWIQCSCDWNSKFIWMQKWRIPPQTHWDEARKHWAEVHPTPTRSFARIHYEQMKMFDDEHKDTLLG